MKEFYSSVINGVELKCKFAFPKNYFTKNFADAKERIFYDIGFLYEIGWEDVNTSTPVFTLNTLTAMDIASGISMVRGNAVFKIFHKESLAELKREIAKGINNGRDKIEFPLIEDNPFTTVEDTEDSVVFDTQDNAEKIKWGQMPLFDIILISQAADKNGVKKLKKMEIRGVRFNSIGFAEGIESLEMNSMASFMAVGKLTDWEDLNATE